MSTQLTESATFTDPPASAFEEHLRSVLGACAVDAETDDTRLPSRFVGGSTRFDVHEVWVLLGGHRETAPALCAARAAAQSASESTPTRPSVSDSTDPDAAETVDVAALYEELRQLEAESARIELRRAQVLGRLIAAQTAADLAAEPDAGPGRRRQAAESARVTVIDSAVASCGGKRGPWQSRSALARCDESVTQPLLEGVAAGTLAFEQACTVIGEVEALDVPTDTQAAIATAVAAYAARRHERTGAPAGQSEFRACLRRQAIKHAGTTRRRQAAQDRRAVWLHADEDGAAVLGIRGADARCVGAYRRVDAIARALRGDGDPRTLSQLRSDVALDLLLFGRPASEAPTSTDNPADPAAGWPTAVVNVVISAAALLGASDEPGMVEDTCVAAETIRRLAGAGDSRWWRIVTDPVTGYAMEAVVKSYRPPAEMARVVRARDGRCRAPGCDRPAHLTQLDHVRERRDGGPTSAAGLQSLCQRHHTKKTRHHWSATIARDGTVRWCLPDGRTYATFPYDYTDVGVDSLDVAAPEDDSAPTPSAAEPTAPATTDTDACDPLQDWLRNRDAALNTEIHRLRTELGNERRASRAWQAAYERLRADNPPF